MKLVLNTTYGGFSISPEAMRRYLTLKGVAFTEKAGTHFLTEFYSDESCSDDGYLSTHDINRTDPALIQTVEELGAHANGLCASLTVVDLPVGTHYRIREYDGYESIEREDEIIWEIAQ